jgi:FtsP/CotA-like multicopper oxidase with cupredoxin domain
MNRRRFMLGGAAATVGALSAIRWPRPALAATSHAPVLSGTEFQLEIGPVPMNVTGRAITATAINGQIPSPILRWREGDRVTLAVTNRLSEPSSIHWHGVRVPSPMDGVPGLSFPGIAPGETYVYRFPVHQSGTYWYHSHSNSQEQTGVYGPIVIDPKAGYPRLGNGARKVRFLGLRPGSWTLFPRRSAYLSDCYYEYFSNAGIAMVAALPVYKKRGGSTRSNLFKSQAF